MKRRISVWLTIALCLLTGCKEKEPSWVLICAEALPELSLEEIIQLNQGMPEITYDANTGAIRELKGRYSPALIYNEQDAVSSLGSVQSLMGFDSLEFALINREENRLGACMYTLQQLYCGLPVYGGVIRITVDANAVGIRIDGLYRKEINLEIHPQISEREICRQIVLNHGESIQSCELSVYIDNQQTQYLSWKITTFSRDPLQCRTIYMDAKNGEQLTSYPNSIF